METFISVLYEKMQAQLQDIADSTGDLLERAEQSYYSVIEYLKDLKRFTKDYEFKDLEEEIRFFKEVKPMFLKEVVYFMKMFDIESAKPVAGIDEQKQYYHSWIKQLRSYFDQNRFFYLYYRMGKAHLDSSLFIREPEPLPMMPNYSLDADPEFSNVYSFKLAKIQALEDMSTFLQSHIESLEDGLDNSGNKVKRRITFKHNNAQAIELIYSLWKSGAFGDVTIKEAFDWAQYSLGIRITNYYGYFQSMRIRKKTRSPYLNLLTESLIRHMDESDEHPRYS